MAKTSATRKELKQRIAILQMVCGEACQLTGALGAHKNALDNLAAAATGRPLPHATFLPVSVADCDEFASAPERHGNKRGPRCADQ